MSPPTGFTVPIDEADPEALDLLGGKGAGLADMSQRGLPVPPAFVITTQACRHYLDTGQLPDGLMDEVTERVRALEERTEKTFGSGPTPLLLSVRSGAPISMPGMMDTILDLGLSRDAALALGERTSDARFVADVARRFQSMYAQTVLGALDEPAGVAEVLAALPDDVTTGDAFDAVWDASRTAIEQDCGELVPDAPAEQLRGAIEAVFRSWNTRRARTYREHHRIPHTLGTAVVVQAMVFGNLGDTSGSGVAFTRNPVDGEPVLFGEFLFGGQGEDVVSGAHTPEPIDDAARRMPAPFDQLREIAQDMERHRGDVLDIEFTVEDGRLYLLQVRSAKRTAPAAVRIAADLWDEGVEPALALAGVTPEHVRQILRPEFDTDELEAARADGRLLTRGTGACPGQVSGTLCFDSDTAQEQAEEGAEVILARPVTSPADLHGMIAARGIVTAVGGSTSHAAVVARALGTACVVGCSEAHIDPKAGTLSVGERVLHAGDAISLDGNSGEIFAGPIAVGAGAGRDASFTRLLQLSADAAGCKVWGRVTLPQHVERVRAANGAGLVLAIDDVLAASGHLDELLDELIREPELSPSRLEAVAGIVTQYVAPLLDAAGELPVSVRAIDLLADEAREYLEQTPLLTARPQLSLPLGVPALLEAQCLGIAAAAEQVSGRRGDTTVAVRHVSSAGEARALAAMAGRVQERHPHADLTLGIYGTSHACLARAAELQEAVPILWIELKTIQAGHLGLPARVLLTREPLDGYLDAGLFERDPRSQLDPDVAKLLAATPQAGIRLSMPATEELAADVFGLGYRRFAVEAPEVAPMLLCLGKAAVAR